MLDVNCHMIGADYFPIASSKEYGRLTAQSKEEGQKRATILN